MTSSISFPLSVKYGLGTLRVMAEYKRFVRAGHPPGMWLSPVLDDDPPRGAEQGSGIPVGLRRSRERSGGSA